MRARSDAVRDRRGGCGGGCARGLRVLLAVLLVIAVARQLRLRARSLGLRFGCLELGGDQRVVLGAQVDLLGVVPAPPAPSAGLLVADELVLALELLDVATVTSSWWATQASVRPWRTQARI